ALPAGQVYVSEIEPTDEAAGANPTTDAVLRASTPIYRGDGTLYGVVVINVDVARWVADVSRLTDADRSVLLLDGPVNYIYILATSQLVRLDPAMAGALRAQYGSLAGIFDGTA